MVGGTWQREADEEPVKRGAKARNHWLQCTHACLGRRAVRHRQYRGGGGGGGCLLLSGG
jgi:hypothetical protein